LNEHPAQDADFPISTWHFVLIVGWSRPQAVYRLCLKLGVQDCPRAPNTYGAPRCASQYSTITSALVMFIPLFNPSPYRQYPGDQARP